MMKPKLAVTLAGLLLAPLVSVSGVEGDGFDRRIEKIEARRESAKPEVLEREFLELLSNSVSSSHKGRVYAAIGKTYKRDVLKDYREVLKYSRLALKEELDTINWVDMEIAQGRALHEEWKVEKKESIKDARARLVQPHLRALKIIGDNLFLRKGRNLSSVKEALRRGEKPDMRMQSVLRQRMKRAMRGCVLLYLEEPYAKDELRGLAEAELGKVEGLVDELMGELDGKLEWREEMVRRSKARPRPKLHEAAPMEMPGR